MQRSRGKPSWMRVWKPPRPPRYVIRKPSFTVGRGPVPRHATIAGETRSDARMETSEAPALRHLARGFSQKRRARACPSPSNDRGGQAPALRHLARGLSQERRARACPSPCNDRGGQAPALRAEKSPFYRRERALAGFRACERVSLARFIKKPNGEIHSCNPKRNSAG